MSAWWIELSSGELCARLLQRGVEPAEAERLVDSRDDEEAAARVEELLG